MGSIFRDILPGMSGSPKESPPNMSLNMTSTYGHSPANPLESVLQLVIPRSLSPVYSVLNGVLLGSLGIDATWVLTVGGIIWGLKKLFDQVYNWVYRIARQYFMSTLNVAKEDQLYQNMMAWLSKQPSIVNSRSLTAETAQKSAWDDDDTKVPQDQMGEYFNFSHVEASRAPQYTPALNAYHSFWWRGTYFSVQRIQESSLESRYDSTTTVQEKERLVISCLGRSPDPIKALLNHAKLSYYKAHRARTSIKRPQTQRGRYVWTSIAERPIREMSTVVLDDAQKKRVLADINEYLHPATPRWYANRGIPLRRGYLFHGPPGSGKTSLSFALAGVFGLDIHVISLLDTTLSEQDLSNLFASLPRRCVVLLEDIDTAGLNRSELDLNPAEEISATGKRHMRTRMGKDISISEKETQQQPNIKPDEPKSPDDWKMIDFANVFKRNNEKSDARTGISLSGLLNAIDGVASHEGRVLIMTTNLPESLDMALIRPGRVDLQVAFTYASQAQTEELFVRMYEAEDTKRSAHAREKGGEVKSEQREMDDSGMLVQDLRAIARQFATRVPDMTFSPAEIQGFLLKRKTDPLMALREVDVWVVDLMDRKQGGTKVLGVQ